MKKIKGSERGITFVTENATIGSKYRYIVDTKKKVINIIPDKNGTITASKKKCGNTIKPLFDIRSKEVKKIIKDSDYMEIEDTDENIVVKIYQKSVSKIRFFKKKNCSIGEFLGTQVGEIIIPKGIMLKATGTYGLMPTMIFGKETLYNEEYFDYLSSQAGNYFKTSNKPKKADIKRVYDVVSLFSGAGVFDKIWVADGRFNFVYANDFCKDVIDTYEYNIGKHIVCKDIRDVKANEVPNSDLFLTSPCCQAFSNANRHNIDSVEGEKKRYLIDEVVRLAKSKNPKVVVVENVPQMITKDNGFYIKRLVDGLSGYEVSVQVVKDECVNGYSKRSRCIAIASRIGKIVLPKMEIVNYRTVRDALSKVDATWYNFKDVTIPSAKTSEKMSYVPPGGNWKDIPKEISGYGPNTQSNVMRRLEWDKPAITLCNFRKSNILHPEENRILTVSEAAAIMGLDKDFHFISNSLSAMQQMVANGVTQSIAKFVKNTVLKALDEYELSNKILAFSN